jgi:lipoate---protein ligase
MGRQPETLRLIDFGSQPPLRSQTLWHAVAYGVSAGAPSTLSLVRPADPYVSIGYHRRLEEVDREACRKAGLPIIRRMIGGGPVYLDAGQLFFQITRPVRAVAIGPKAMRQLLEPAVLAFQDLGVPATFEDVGDIVAGPAKISGIGGGQIEDAAVAVGNLIERFDHDRMTAVLAVEDDVRREALRLMRAYVRATPVDPEAFKAALVARYSDHLGVAAEEGELTRHEWMKVDELDARFSDAAWLAGPARPQPAVRQIKIRSEVWVFSAQLEGTRVVGSVIRGRLDRLRVIDPSLNGRARDLEQALVGVPLADAASATRGFGAAGDRAAAAIAMTNGRRL